ncbi:MAG: hypothetical protein ACI9TV_002628 [Sulfurimonas sp.]|jgi:hypothetical protein|uniref:3-deoxy-D-manno-octulosonic acid transferase n=1 Tax=Sulfurimonas sp. TaxID=2022749 RepID=UPI0039E2DB41
MKQNDYLTNNFNIIYFFLFTLGLFLSYWYATHQIVDGDITQMLDKGYHGFYTGEWSSYGNAASVVGNVPGSLLAFVVGLPLFIVDSPWAPMGFLLFLHAISFFLLDNVIKNIFDNKMRLVFLVVYWLNPWFLFENILYNPSYLFFFSALHLWTAFKMKNESSFIYSFLHILSIGMAMQLHYSWIILAVMTAYLFLKNVIKINWYGIAFSFAVIIISLIPYIQEFIHNAAIRSNEGNKDDARYIGWGGVHVYPVLKAFLYWLRYGSFIFTNKLVTSANFDWLTTSLLLQQILTYAYQAILFAFGAVTLWVSFKANKYLYYQLKGSLLTRYSQALESKVWLSVYILSALIGVFISAVLSPIVFNYWHLLIIFPFALLPFLLFIETLAIEKINKYFFPVLIYLLCINFIAAIDSKKYDLNANYSNQVIKHIEIHNLNGNK